jgi:Zn-dependent protease
MKWSWRLGRVFGIDVFVHPTFLVLLAWVGISHYTREHDAAGALAGVAFMLMVFAIVVMHELGHALTARSFGILTRDITLLPIGGIARLERMPDKPRQELAVALAGPAVNVVLALGLFALLRVTDQMILPLTDDDAVAAPVLTKLLWANVSLAIFNLLPAFPMDGGRALRALLALRGDYVQATRTAAGVGQAMALLIGVVGLFYNPMLVLIAWFVWVGAANEASAVQTKATLSGVPVQAAMMTDFHALAVDDTLATASQALLAGSQVDFPVVDGGGAPVGLLTRHSLVRGLTEAGPNQLVGAVMAKSIALADQREMLVSAMQRLRAHDGNTLMVVSRDGRLIGLLTAENLGEMMMLQEALRARAATHAS